MQFSYIIISILEQNVPFCLTWNKMFCYNKNRNKMFRRVREKEIKSMSFFVLMLCDYLNN